MSKIPFSIFFLLIIYSLFFYSTKTFAFTFDRNLKLGDTGNDVFELQKILNKDGDTAVSLSGIGSKGSETYYFGEKTQKAVIAFQKKYARDILIPQGLSYATGFVGPSTRQKMNNFFVDTIVKNNQQIDNIQIEPYMPVSGVSLPVVQGVGASLVQNPINTSSVGSFFSDDDKKVQLVFLSSNYGKRGSMLTLSGNNFSLDDNKIHFGSNVVSGIKAINKNNITMTVPTSVPVGVYDIEIENNTGKSESSAYFVVLDDSSVNLPKINSVSPSTVSNGAQIVISGDYFTPTQNTIMTSIGAFKNINSVDGKTLKFNLNVPSDLNIEKIFNADSSFELPVYIYVVNSNGVSDRLYPSMVKIKNI
jgi:peptidoglycan hydrolase-like protein with peptidoglycan-binding domain